jgi:NAD(P)-dependent dehydrogenase (short-subunit alcohol dehydrogenase family)
LRALGYQAIAVPADVTQRDQVEAAVEAVISAFGELHILVNNAGVTRDNLLFKMTDADWTTRRSSVVTISLMLPQRCGRLKLGR